MTVSKRWDLEGLIHPFSADEFLSSHYERALLHVERSDPEYFASLLELDEIDRVLTTLHPSHPAVHMVKAGEHLEVEDYTYESGLIDVVRLYQHFDDGASIVLNNLEASLPHLMSLCRTMESAFSARFQCNIYLTPGGGAQGLRTHFDTHDAFVLQVHGRKRWRIYDTPLPLPLRAQEFTPDAYEPGPLEKELILEPGDMLYVPRGLMHDAASTDEESCHITLGALPKTWSELLVEAVEQVAHRDVAFREGLPVGFARDGFERTEARETFRALLSRLTEHADFDDVLEHFVDDLVGTRHPLARGQIHQIRALASLGVDTRARARADLVYTTLRDAKEISVEVYGGRISLPLHAAAALERALDRAPFRVGDLPGLGDKGKLVLVRRLVREGLVEIELPS